MESQCGSSSKGLLTIEMTWYTLIHWHTYTAHIIYLCVYPCSVVLVRVSKLMCTSLGCVGRIGGGVGVGTKLF